MESLLYLAVCCYVGCLITKTVITPAVYGRKMNTIWILIAASFGTGTLVVTWALYFTAFVMHTGAGIKKPLFPANILIITAILALFAVRAFKYKKKKEKGERTEFISDRSLFRKECILYAVLFAFILFTDIYVLFQSGERLYAGYTVFGDYAPHTAMMRSFSRMANYPTQYPHFGGADVKYHFMFQFLAGNLEYLGMRIDIAYNLISTLSLWGFLVILCQMAYRISGRFSAMALSPVFLLFRSGTAFFRFIAEHLKAGDLIAALRDNASFIGYTPNEDWGLWNYNVYLNQRHFGFGLLIVAVVIWVFLELFEKGTAVREAVYKTDIQETGNKTDIQETGNKTDIQETGSKTECIQQTGSKVEDIKEAGDKEVGIKEPGIKGAGLRFFTPASWKCCYPERALLLGMLLGLCSFWNGACVIGGLLILFGMALFSDGKTDYLILAMVSVLFSVIETHIFIYGSAVSPSFYWGFISEDKSLAGVILYLVQIMGVTIAGLCVGGFFLNKRNRLLTLAFLMPTAFAFCFSLTPDINVNHKYIMITAAFLSAVWGILISRLLCFAAGMWRTKKARAAVSGAFAAILIVSLTATGFYDFITILRRNDSGHRVSVYMESDLTDWLNRHLTEKDLILTPEYSINEMTLSGAMMYLGWPYYAWSAGYDTWTRSRNGMLIYGTDNREELIETVKREKITFILYEEGMTYEENECREDLISEVYPRVYTTEDGRIRIYETGIEEEDVTS